MRHAIVAATLGLYAAGCVGEVPGTNGSNTIPDAATAGVDAPAGGGSADAAPTTKFSFFITGMASPNGGDFRRAGMNDTDGLAGADEICKTRAAAGVPASAGKTWRAYLSTSTVNARDRIGTGPWYNRNDVMVAASLTALHDPAMNMINGTIGIDENGAVVPVATHDILTGSNDQGIATANTCSNWTSSAATGIAAQVGHYNRAGGGDVPSSWNAAHATNGCSAAALTAIGGRGSIYCFATN